MRPWQHACSSVRSAMPKAGLEWTEALAVHEFIDLSKSACADRRHRIVLHHVDLGLAVAGLAFPGFRALDSLIVQHVQEDLGHAVKLADWLNCVDDARLPRAVPRRIAGGPEGIAQLVCAKLPDHPTVRSAVDGVSELLFLPTSFCAAPPHLAICVLMNTVGPTLARRIFGPPLMASYDGNRVVIDYGWIAEAVIMASFGRIPDLSELVDALIAEPIVRAPMKRGAAA